MLGYVLFQLFEVFHRLNQNFELDFGLIATFLDIVKVLDITEVCELADELVGGWEDIFLLLTLFVQVVDGH